MARTRKRKSVKVRKFPIPVPRLIEATEEEVRDIPTAVVRGSLIKVRGTDPAIKEELINRGARAVSYVAVNEREAITPDEESVPVDDDAEVREWFGRIRGANPEIVEGALRRVLLVSG